MSPEDAPANSNTRRDGTFDEKWKRSHVRGNVYYGSGSAGTDLCRRLIRQKIIVDGSTEN